jgi:4-carboxymuconolactone decarboxylase
MKLQTASALPIILLLVTAAHAKSTHPDGGATTVSTKQSQTITRADSHAYSIGPVEYFTGNVRVSPLFPANSSTPVSGA